MGDVSDLNLAYECHVGGAGCHASKFAPVSALVGHADRAHHPGSGVHDVEPAVGSSKQVDRHQIAVGDALACLQVVTLALRVKGFPEAEGTADDWQTALLPAQSEEQQR